MSTLVNTETKLDTTRETHRCGGGGRLVSWFLHEVELNLHTVGAGGGGCSFLGETGKGSLFTLTRTETDQEEIVRLLSLYLSLGRGSSTLGVPFLWPRGTNLDYKKERRVHRLFSVLLPAHIMHLVL